MQNLRTGLPQPDLLIAFEAAARHSSFTLAARELNVTQSAVSQRIRNLEAGLGVTLFERGHRFVRLTPNGREFYNSVSVALTHLLNAANRLRISEAGPTLNIATDESFAMFRVRIGTRRRAGAFTSPSRRTLQVGREASWRALVSPAAT